MKKILVIVFFLFTFLAGNFIPGLDASEWAKFSNLIEHYKEHRLENKDDLSFVEFLWLHYGIGEDADKHRQQENHEHIPHAHHNSTSIIHFVLVPDSEYLLFSVLNSNPVLNSGYNEEEYFEYNFSTFLPPKI